MTRTGIVRSARKEATDEDCYYPVGVVVYRVGDLHIMK